MVEEAAVSVSYGSLVQLGVSVKLRNKLLRIIFRTEDRGTYYLLSQIFKGLLKRRPGKLTQVNVDLKGFS